jgi:hypothetical protein
MISIEAFKMCMQQVLNGIQQVLQNILSISKDHQ